MKKTTFALLPLVMLVLVFACNRDSLKNCEEHDVDPCQVDTAKTNIRIKNVSDYDYCNVIVKTGHYGILKAGETTCYLPFDKAYRYAYVHLYIGDKAFTIQPIDYVGETPLGKGKFTYLIGVDDYKISSLTIEYEED